MVLEVVAGIGISVADRLPDAGRLITAESWPPDLSIQQAADRQGIVPNLLGIQS
jgi:hypothetical protein